MTRLDRLSRSVLHLVTLGANLRERGIGLHVIEQGIDTSTVEGRAMFGMLSVLAELQRELIVANTMDGLASARARGRVGGRTAPPQPRTGRARPAAVRRPREDRPADRGPVRRSPFHGLRAPRQDQGCAPPAQEDHDHETLTLVCGW
ncbi:recombinase family protein [Streptomyces sp. NBC_01296]|nr:recombinase family protein [Streptomyces sp. NBC_01296]